MSGTATFGAQKILKLGTDPSGDSPGGIRELDLIEAKLGQLDLSTGDLNFVFKVTDLQVVAGIPELVSYHWPFRLDPLEWPLFRIEGRFSDLHGGDTRVPAFVLHVCRPAGGELTCTNGPLVGEMVGSDNEIFVDVPWTLLEREAGRSLQGTRIVPAGPDAAGALETRSGPRGLDQQADTLSGWSAYDVAYRRVDVSISAPGGPPGPTTSATVSGTSFSASLDASGLAPGLYQVLARACYGTNCATRSTTVTV